MPESLTQSQSSPGRSRPGPHVLGTIPARADGAIRPPMPSELEVEAGHGHAIHLDIDLESGAIRKLRVRTPPA